MLTNVSTGGPIAQHFFTEPGSSNGTNQSTIPLMNVRTLVAGDKYRWELETFDGGGEIVSGGGNTQLSTHEVLIGGLNQP
jgi:hypothetical protein